MTEDELVNEGICTQQEYEFERDNREYVMDAQYTYYNADFSENDACQERYTPEYHSEDYENAYYRMKDEDPIISEQESSERKLSDRFLVDMISFNFI